MKIKVLKNGPYLVSGNVPLAEKKIVHNGKNYVYEDTGIKIPQAPEYALCRCGKTKTPPFCDGSHVHEHFDGTETASKLPYMERARKLTGPGLTIMDDSRCALGRFCHLEDGDVWQLLKASSKEKFKEEAIKGCLECPAGRLVALDEDGNQIENKLEPAIEFLQDPEKGVSCGIFVKGNIPIESEDGELYEVRNRVVLCRCGESKNKPFCDASHVKVNYLDKNKMNG